MASTQTVDHSSLRERLRNLEILKYGYAMRTHLITGSSLTADDSSPRLAADAILTGLCQLVAVRLKCSSALICLNDPLSQHIIAEATQTVSPYDQSVHAPGDGITFGVQSFDNSYGITRITLPAYSLGQQNFVANHFTSISDQRSIFLDLRKEPLVSDVPFLQTKHSPRFYLEVPLKNPAGTVVGIVAVLDSQPRSGFDEVDVRPIIDAARMITEHMELVRLRDLNAHAERLLQGLGHFNAGQSSITQWVQDHPGEAIPSDSSHGRREPGESQSPQSPTEMAPYSRMSTLPPIVKDDLIQQQLLGNSLVPVAAPSGGASFDVTLQSGSDHTAVHSDQSRPAPPSPKNGLLPSVQGLPDTARLQKGEVTSAVQSAFARAANLIREAMDLASTCFLEIPSHSRFNMESPEPRNTSARPTDKSSPKLTATRSMDSPSWVSSESDHMNSLPDRDQSTNSGENSQRGLCTRVAFSTRSKSSLAQSFVDDAQMTIPQRTLGSLASLYPQGHVFQFDALGPVSSGNDSENSQEPDGRRSRRRNITKTLSASFPAARSLLFLPLYNNEQGRLYSAFFGWTDDPYRVLVENDVIYVGGFAHSLMSEVMRLETIALERTKSVFIASISHELRSPLHGILAAAELLQESSLGAEQKELVLMMDICGKSLLDILNNLLQHAEINNMIDNRKRKKPLLKHKGGVQSSPKAIKGRERAIVVASLAKIVEETVISVAASHTVKAVRTEQMSLRTPKPAEPASDTERPSSDHGRPPIIVLDIQKSDKWYFPVESGVWRRIVLNLVGNALKYTTSGYIAVSLSLVEPVRVRRGSNHIAFTVSDSGRGMSESYMKNRLYTPFAQEDHLSAGVGLGLSIVDRLVADLNGSIFIDSKIGVGTNVRVAVPLPPEAQIGNASEPFFDGYIATTQQAESTPEVVCFCGFDQPVAEHDESIAVTDGQTLGLTRLKQSLTVMVNEWLAVATTPDPSTATVYIVEASFARALLTSDPSHVMFQRNYIVVHAHGEDRDADLVWPGSYKVIAAPIGPLKLARVFTTLSKQRRRQSQQVEQSDQQPKDPVPTSTDEGSPKRQELAERASNTDNRSPVGPLPLSSGVRDDAGLRVLLVDDNDINVRVLAGLVRKLKIAYSTANNGQEALDQCVAAYEQGRPFRYILMDISMPIMDGLTSTRHIRAYEREKRIREPAQIFALTGLGHADTQNEAIASGVNQYFRKPVSMDTLRRAIVSHPSPSPPLEVG